MPDEGEGRAQDGRADPAPQDRGRELEVLPHPAKLDTRKLLDSQLKRPLFEFSGACAGCGETPYVKLLTQICGDRLLIANATGCSSIYGGNLPTTPYCQRADGRGPAWSNSLFEDNAQFGLGMRVSADKLHGFAMELVDKVIANEKTPAEMKALCEKIKAVDQYDEKGQGVEQMRALVKDLKKGCEAGKANGCPICAQLLAVADNLVRKSVWVLGGDGWAYDIGYGGLDHVLASGKNIKILVMDTEVYSNTGGQASKATPTGAPAQSRSLRRAARCRPRRTSASCRCSTRTSTSRTCRWARTRRRR